MTNVLKRTATAVGLALTLVVLTGAPAFAATDNINASVVNNVVTVSSSTNVPLGDTVTLTNTSTTGTPAFSVFGGANCGNGGGTNFGSVPVGGVITLGTFNTPAFQVGSVVHFSILTLTGCTPFDLLITAASPPPDVPETPYIAGLLGVAAVVFGIAFFTMRRRRHRIV